MISLFSFDDEEMLEAKFGAWWENNPQRGRANNSAVAVRDKITEDDFWRFWKKVEASRAGEPGIFFTNDSEWGLNPCAEISLRTNQFCNLTTINAATIESQEDLEERVWAATLLGTLQAGYTNFHYLRPIWKKTTEKEALLGVSMTGIASGKVMSYDLKKASSTIKSINKKYADILGINAAARASSIKPEGTTSLLLGTSSGMHAWHNDYYLRRVRVNKNEAIYSYLKVMYPELLEEDYFSPQTTAIITVPQRAPDDAILRTEPAVNALERLKSLSIDWVRPGHTKGKNRNNVSCTISVKDNEWDEVGSWMWENREFYTAVAVLPADLGTYIQAPFEDLEDRYVMKLEDDSVLRLNQNEIEVRNGEEGEVVKKTISELANHINGFQVRSMFGKFKNITSLKYMTKREQYEELASRLHAVDVSHVPEEDDNTSLQGELACAGSSCDVK
jgi:ribonucleoside-diphosphate reductase alpha chain